MPRGRVGGSTAALIDALAERGVAVSAYQIERWRAAGALPRPVRHGLGRGRGVVSDEPDEQTIQRAIALKLTSRRGSRRMGTHVIERLAMGLPVDDAEVRRAFNDQFDELEHLAGATAGPEDESWQTRQDIANHFTRSYNHIGLQALIDAVDDVPSPPPADQARRAKAFSGLSHVLMVAEEALSEDLIELVALFSGLSEEETEELRRAQLTAELRGEDPWAAFAEQMSLRSLRRTITDASLDDLRRATGVVLGISPLQAMVVVLGVLDISGSPITMPGLQMNADAETVRRLQADPMWARVNTTPILSTPKQRVQALVLTSLGILVRDELEAWEAYLQRLVHVIYGDVREDQNEPGSEQRS